MSFYVTLPSNTLINNTLSNFTTKLDPAIILESDEYEVGLAEIMFPYNWTLLTNEYIVIRKKPQGSIAFYMGNYSYQTADDFSEIINGFCLRHNFGLTFWFNKVQSKWQIRLNKEISITFYNNANEFLGFKNTTIETVQEPITTADFTTNYLYHGFNAIYVYSDISKYQNVGDTYAPLLRTVAITQDMKYGHYVNEVFETPHYKPVCTKFINSIEIKLTTDTGKPVKFASWGKVIVTLHFKPKR